MAVHRRDKRARDTTGAPPRIRVARTADGSLELKPQDDTRDVQPETVAPERPTHADDRRPVMRRDVGGPYSA